jgi:hypothetical protein
MKAHANTIVIIPNLRSIGFLSSVWFSRTEIGSERVTGVSGDYSRFRGNIQEAVENSILPANASIAYPAGED